MTDEPSAQPVSLDALDARIARRRESGESPSALEQVLLAFARWQHSADVERASCKEALDQQLDRLEPEQWRDLKEMIGEIDDRLLLEVMQYSAERALAQSQELVREVEALDPEVGHEEPYIDDDEPEPDDDEPSL